jgi:hypothetical protein
MVDHVSDQDLDDLADAVDDEDLSAEDFDEDVLLDDGDDKQKDLDNAEKSRLGRKVAAMRKEQEDFQGEMRQMLADIQAERRFAQNRTSMTVEDEPVNDLDFDDDDPITYADFKRIQEREQQLAKRQTDKYANAYTGVIHQIGAGEQDRNLHDAVVKELMANHNVKRSENGELDAQLNYAKAQAVVFRQLADGKNPLEKNHQVTSPLGGSVHSSDEPRRAKPKHKLDAYAQDLANRMGLSQKEIDEALDGEAPVRLGGR